MVRVRFSGVTSLSERGMTCSFWLTEKLDSPRFTRLELIPPNNWIHTFRIRSLEELDEEVLGWLKQAYRVGEQRHLLPE